MPYVYVKAPDTPDEIRHKLAMAEQSKAALQKCLDNMRANLIANVNTWDYLKIEQYTREIKSTQKGIATQEAAILKLKEKTK